MQINWSNSRGYAFNSTVGFLHRLIFENIEENKYVDHINGDKSDNRRSNLRLVTKDQNRWNSSSQKGNYSSKYKGVSWNKAQKKWIATCMFNKKYNYLGSFDCEILAAKKYNEFALSCYGEFARLNVIDKIL